VNSDTFKFYHINKVIDFDRSRDEENETQEEEVPVNSEHEEDDSASRKSDL